ncbi:MAG: SUF system Fe-S cluster assembly regulator [Gammaproteobacteria bacterium]
MLRISKLTDYAIVMMVYVAHQKSELITANAIAKETNISLPTVKKILRMLLKSNLLISAQGSHGGYYLSQEPASISVAHIITAMEGQIALTMCNTDEMACDKHEQCMVKQPWQLINRVIKTSLESITLEDMAKAYQADWQPVIFNKLDTNMKKIKGRPHEHKN